MLIKGAILVVLIITAFFFLGVKMSESITDPGIRGFFFALYFLTIFTVFNVILSFYFIIKLQGKRGPQGKKGLQGGNGDRGETGTCEKTTCRKKTVELLIRNKIEQDLASNGGLTEAENKVMCAMFKSISDTITLPNLQKIKENCDNVVNTYEPDIDDLERKKETDVNPIFDHINTKLYKDTLLDNLTIGEIGSC
tara:strand:+ start:525 stop:1109 length:585 start_codon:yes stop_codon:yes gene_type:complete